jgi:hypothetical protein
VPSNTKPPRIKGKPLEASYRHLQRSPFHAYLLKVAVIIVKVKNESPSVGLISTVLAVVKQNLILVDEAFSNY